MRWLVTAIAVCCVPVSLAEEAISRIAFGSCAFQSVPQPIFRTIADSKPDLYISLGDAIYADYDLKTKTPYDVTEESLRRDWQVLKDSPDWQYLVSRVPVMATWDNHDYGHYQAGEEFELKEVSKEIFLDFFNEPKDSVRRDRPGIYEAKIIGPEGKRVQIILLDTRSFKAPPVLAKRPEDAKASLGKFAPNTDKEASLLGETQWRWLEQQLQQPAELRLLVSSIQVVADEKGMDEWGVYPMERERLFGLMEKMNANNVIVLSGNVHFSEVSRLQEGDFSLVDFTSSGLTHANEQYAAAANRLRVAGPYDGKSFGVVEIDWHASPSPTVKLLAISEQGERVFEYDVSLLQ
jgi:alkaline phosphatase D